MKVVALHLVYEPVKQFWEIPMDEGDIVHKLGLPLC